ncbi:MAG: nucleotidyltransferase domain-containing protein [Treponema sp.]|nr:nucleotidyltransferase domain-containing protein [Treponema sp.]
MKLPRIELDDFLIISLAKKYRMKELSLFGSVLRDDFSDKSDIDLLVQFDENVELSLFDLFEIREAFEKAFGREVDLIEKAGLRNPYRRDRILSTAKVVYAA